MERPVTSKEIEIVAKSQKFRTRQFTGNILNTERRVKSAIL